MKIQKQIALLVSMLLVSGVTYAGNDKAKGKDKQLPPGLHKKHEQGKPLPPGWQKKFAVGDVLDNDIYAKGRVVVPVGVDGSISIEVDGTIIKLHEKTRKILEILSE